MVKIRREGNKTTWLLEEETLSGRLHELAAIFKYHSNHSDNDRMDSRFMAETLSMQTDVLFEMAHKQEREIERLRRVERDLAELRAEFKTEIDKLKQAPQGALDKPAMRRPSNDVKK
jgi:hypothetical protein